MNVDLILDLHRVAFPLAIPLMVFILASLEVAYYLGKIFREATEILSIAEGEVINQKIFYSVIISSERL